MRLRWIDFPTLSALFDDDDALPEELAVITWVQSIGEAREKFCLIGQVMRSSQADFWSLGDGKAAAEEAAHAAGTDLSQAERAFESAVFERGEPGTGAGSKRRPSYARHRGRRRTTQLSMA